MISSFSEIAKVTRLRKTIHTTLNGLEWTFKAGAIVVVISLVSVNDKKSCTDKADGGEEEYELFHLVSKLQR